ncbi:hypothetical protein [Streptomyces sp. NPDC013457]|uniref:hypothetical protein n=1 Tax=Streptomyces sp. NPDC013457 TaxID=3364866 RepID=UPI0036FA4075
MFTRRDRGAAESAPGQGREQRAPEARDRLHLPGQPQHLTPAHVHALQRTVGNAAAVRALGRQHTVQRVENGSDPGGGTQGGQTQAGGSRYRIQIQTAKNSRSHHLDYWGNLAFGHAWVALYKEEGGQETWKSYGFFPAEEVARDKPFRSVKGQVKRNHDSPDSSTSRLTAELTEEQYNRAREYIRANEGHAYNLATFNCTTFARSVFQAATGEPAPGLGLPLLENPNTLQDSIKRRNDRSGAPRKGENITADVGSNSDYDSDSSTDSWSNPLGGFRQMGEPEAEVAAPAAAPPARPAGPVRPRFEID